MTQGTWQRTYGGYSTEEGNSVVLADNDHYLVVGSTGSFGNGSSDIYVLMLGSDGERLWSMTLGGSGVDRGEQVKRTSDGGYVIVGFTNSSGNGGYDGYMVRLDATGSPLWERTFGGAGWDLLFSVVERPDGGFMAAGETFSNGESDSDAWLVQVTEDGDLVTSWTYGGAQADLSRYLVNCSSGGYALAGACSSDEDQDAWVIRVDDNGDTLWTWTQGGDSLDIAYSITETLDGGFVVVGSTKSFSTYIEGYHFKVDSDGSFAWEWNYGQTHDEETYEVLAMSDGRFLTTGYATPDGSSEKDLYILYFNEDGTFHRGIRNSGENGLEDEVGRGVALTADGGSIHCGSSSSFGFGSQDVYVVKTNDTGWTVTNVVDEIFDPTDIIDREPLPPPSIFPNPATIACRLTSRYRLHSARLLDMQGRAVRSWTGNVPYELDLTGLSPGSYHLASSGEAGQAIQPLIITGP